MALLIAADIEQLLIGQKWVLASYAKDVPKAGSLWLQSQKEILCWNGGTRTEVIELPFSRVRFFTKYFPSTGSKTLIIAPPSNDAYIYSGLLPGSFRPDDANIIVERKRLSELLP